MPSSNAEKAKKPPLSLPYEKQGLFSFSETPISVSEIVKRLNDLADQRDVEKMSYATILSWLLEIGALNLIVLPSGKEKKCPTSEGAKLEITVEARMGVQGSYQVIVYL